MMRRILREYVEDAIELWLAPMVMLVAPIIIVWLIDCL